MNKIETARLATAIHALRPDWPTASLKTLIETRLTDHAWLDATLALAYVALDPNSRTPARVLEAGPWWEATRIATGEQTPIPEFDFQALYRAKAQRMPTEDAAPLIAQARANIRVARAALHRGAADARP